MDRTATAVAVALALVLLAAVLGEGPPASPAPGPPAGYTFYQVRRGETLFRIARAHGVSVEELARLNGLEDPHYIQAGQILLVPRLSSSGPTTLPALADPAAQDGSGELQEPAVQDVAPQEPALQDPALQEAARQWLSSLDDRELLARIIWLEARGEPLEGQVAVGAVVLNRVRHPGFPDSVAGVLAQPGQFGFGPAEILAARPGPAAYLAASRALAGEDPTGGALFFYNPDKTRTPEFWARRTPLVRIGNHVFAR